MGQKQRWFLLQLAADDSGIRFDTTVEPEFDRWRWVDYWDPVQEVIYFKRPVYVKALHELAPLARPDGLPPYPAWWARQTRAPRAQAAPAWRAGRLMAAPRPRVVVRNHAPGRRALLIGGAVLLVLVGMLAAFEWGRSRAGFDGAAARRERAELNDQISALEDELRGARLKLAMYDSDTAGQTRERNELSRTIGDLQTEVAQPDQ